MEGLKLQDINTLESVGKTSLNTVWDESISLKFLSRFLLVLTQTQIR